MEVGHHSLKGKQENTNHILEHVLYIFPRQTAEKYLNIIKTEGRGGMHFLSEITCKNIRSKNIITAGNSVILWN